MNEDGGFVLVAMLHKTKRLKGEPAVLGYPIFQDNSPGVNATSAEEQD